MYTTVSKLVDCGVSTESRESLYGKGTAAVSDVVEEAAAVLDCEEIAGADEGDETEVDEVGDDMDRVLLPISAAELGVLAPVLVGVVEVYGEYVYGGIPVTELRAEEREAPVLVLDGESCAATSLKSGFVAVYSV